MTSERSEQLVTRLNEIQEEIGQLNNEAATIIEELTTSIANQGKEGKKTSIREKLQSLGFKVSSSTKKNTRILKINKNDIKYSVLFKHSKFHNDSRYNAWYTFNADVEKVVDFLILAYVMPDNNISYLIVPQEIFIQIISKLSPTRDNKRHLFLNADIEKAGSTEFTIDLSPYINNFKLISD